MLVDSRLIFKQRTKRRIQLLDWNRKAEKVLGICQLKANKVASLPQVISIASTLDIIKK